MDGEVCSWQPYVWGASLSISVRSVVLDGSEVLAPEEGSGGKTVGEMDRPE